MTGRHINVENIYEALFDEERFEALPGEIAAGLGARSVLLHWHFGDGTADVLAHSGYFTDEQLEIYARDFAPLDPWAAATAGPQADGEAMNLEEVVSPEQYERSIFYNEYVRPMGDDTYRCMGLRTYTSLGSGMIAVQRGKTQPSFTPEEVAALDTYSPHLRRLLILRGRISGLQERATTTTAALDAMRDAALILTGEGRLVHANLAGERLLSAGFGLTLIGGTVRTDSFAQSERLHQLVRRACSSNPDVGNLMLARGRFPPLIVAVSPLRDGSGGRRALLTVQEGAPDEGAKIQALKELFGLSLSEAEVAERIANGRTATEVAAERRVSVGTIRAQLKSVFSKLGCTRQTDLAILVNTIPGVRRCS